MAAPNPQTAIDNLQAALAAGVKTVRIGDRMIEYQSQKEILAAINYFQSLIDGTSTESVKQIKVSYTKGD